ncbi:hypothetical protein EEL31_23465 [Brevibacillus laterosporus]|nr:hypothetical protein EEL31_23465 [Brevibacillus laterosporus]
MSFKILQNTKLVVDENNLYGKPLEQNKVVFQLFLEDNYVEREQRNFCKFLCKYIPLLKEFGKEVILYDEPKVN